MTAQALAKMALAQGLQLLSRHEDAEAIGTVEECWVEEGTLRVAGRLHSGSPEARLLYKRLRAGARPALSVGGRLREVHHEVDGASGRRVRCLDDVELHHVAVCDAGEALNPDAYVEIG